MRTIVKLERNIGYWSWEFIWGNDTTIEGFAEGVCIERVSESERDDEPVR